MRVGLLTTSFPRFEGDVAGHFVLGFARALAACGHDVEVLAPEPANSAPPPHFSPLDVRWVRYAPRPLERTFYGAGVLDNLKSDPLAALGLAPFVVALAAEAARRMHAWDALVSHWALPCALVAGALRGARPHLAVLHSADVFLLEHLPLRGALAKQIARTASALVFASRNLRERFLALLPAIERTEVASRAHVCAMGIDRAPRAALREHSRSDGFTLLSLGRLVEIKGIEHAISALERVDGAELVIAGEGPARESLEARARSGRARVRFAGPVRGPEKEALFARADAFVLPSVPLASGRSEGMPTTLLEAMERGLPVVASDTGGVSDVLEHERNGLLVEAGDPEAIARALHRLMAEPDLRARLGQEARRTAAEYHWSVLAPRFAELLETR